MHRRFPTMAEGFLWWAVRNDVSDIQLLFYWAEIRLDVLFLTEMPAGQHRSCSGDILVIHVCPRAD